MGKASGHRVVRINLSEQASHNLLSFVSVMAKTLFCVFIYLYVFLVQTDMMDLLGSDLPVESDEGVMFSWSDGILLQVDLSLN